MPTNVTLNGTSYAIPATGEGGWGTSVTNYLIALSSGVLQKAGGSFTLTAETDFGGTYGLKSVYFKSRNTPATAGIFRLGNAEAVSWRNAANSADLDLKVNSSDILEFGGNPITTLPLGSAHEVLTMNAGATASEYAKIDNDNVATAAAIDAAKIADASVSNTEFQYLNGATSSIQTQFGAKLDDVATANDNEIPRFNTNGQALQNSGVTIDDSNNMAGIANVIISGAIDAASASNLDIGGTTATTINIGRSGQTTVIKGDLQVEGTTTTVDSTVLDVADKNITINKGGNQASADGGGFTLEMSDATDVAMVYLSSLASRFKIGDVGSETEVMSVGAIQVITAQKAFDTQVWLKEITTPTTPDSGYRALYPKSDGKLYTLNDAGEEIAVGSGSGQGEINYITNSDAETNTSDWTATGLATIARTNTLGELLRGAYSFKLASTGAGTIYTDFTIPEADENKKLKIEHDLKEISGYAAGEWTLKIIKDPAGTATDITPATTDIPGGQGQFLTTFDCTDADTYRLIYTCTGATNGVTIDNVIVGPGKVTQGFAGWTQYDISSHINLTSGTVSYATGMPYKTQDGTWRLRFSVYTTGVTSSTTQDFTMDGVQWARLYEAGTSSGDSSGSLTQTGNTSTDPASIVVRYNSAQTLFRTSGDFELISIPTWATDNSIIDIGNTDVEYAYNTDNDTLVDTTSFGYGPAGVNFPGSTMAGASAEKSIQFQGKIQTTDIITMEVDISSTGQWVAINTIADAVTGCPNGMEYQNGTWYGAGIASINASTGVVKVRLGKYAYNASTYGGTGANWDGTTDNHKWRLKKSKKESAVGFGLASATESGLQAATTLQQDLTVTGAGWTTIRAVGVAYSDHSGNWRMKFNISGTCTTTTSFVATISGVTFKSGSGNYQSVATVPHATADWTYGNATAGGSTVTCRSGTTQNGYSMAGDVELDSKPTWA